MEVFDNLHRKDLDITGSLVPIDLESWSLLTWTGRVLTDHDLWHIDYESWSVSGDVVVWNGFVSTGDNLKTWTVVLEPNWTVLRNESDYKKNDPIKYIDAIVFLLEETQTELVKNNYVIKFKKMLQSDKDYVYFKTAFDKKLIGKDTNPDASLKCDNYIVMKWILLNRDVNGFDGDIFDKYFEFAEKNGELNGCERGKYVVKSNL